jgi:hypothetical protein
MKKFKSDCRLSIKRKNDSAKKPFKQIEFV